MEKVQAPRFNITREERKLIDELRRDKNRIILTANKGVSMVVMDRDDYNKKAQELLQQSAYRPIPHDPTNKLKTRLISLLKHIKTEGGMNEATYKRLYPTGAGSPKFYGLTKVHKQGTPLSPIVSSIGAVTYQTSKELSRILKPLVGKSPHHIHNNQDFLKHLKGIRLAPDEVMASCDVKALFPSVPIKSALDVIKKLLEEDPGLHPPLLWKRFVDDTFVIIKKVHREEFLTHLNSVDENIQFTAEEPGPEGSLPFLDILITPDDEGRLNTTVYRKATNTDQYLHWDSLHPISSKYSVVGTLHHRTRTVCSNTKLLQQEEEHLANALKKCNYPMWALNRIKIKMNNPAHKKNKASSTQQNNSPKPYITVPYYKGLGESVKKRCSNYGVQVYFKGGTTIKILLMAPKDIDPMMKKSGVIYSYKCGRVECDEEYIGESS